MTTYTNQLAGIRVAGNAATLELTPDWLQGRSGYGGWQAALAVRAMRTVLGDGVTLRSLQANFIAPVPPGNVTASAELLRRGKSVAQVEARILVDGKVAFATVGIFGASRQSAIVEQPQAPAAEGLPEAGSDWTYIEGMTPEFARKFHYRWVAGEPPYSGSEHRNGQIFVRFRDEEVSTEEHLICMADATPPSGLSRLKSRSMLSTINWTLELINPIGDAERGDWFRFDSSLTAATDGYSWENTAIWSAKGTLIALSRQCLAVFG